MKLSKLLMTVTLVSWELISLAIIGGNDINHAKDDISSSLVALQMSEIQPDGTTRFYKGSAFLIGKNMLLTAAHNVAYIPNPNDIKAIFSSVPCWGENICDEKRITVGKVAVHPLFRQIRGGTEYDIAIIKLAENAPSDYQAIKLINYPLQIGTQDIQVLGFGADSQKTNLPLSNFRLRLISRQAVDPDYLVGSSQKFWIDQRDGGICGGDSGGPAIIKDGDDFTAIGLAIHVTYQDGIGNCLTMGAFTDLLFFKEWIGRTIAEF